MTLEDYRLHPEKYRQRNIKARQRIDAKSPNQYRSRRFDESLVKYLDGRAKKRALPNTFTKEQWAHCLEYFHNCCAVCGRQEGFWNIIAMDHWIALTDSRTDNPGTVVENIIPLCHGWGGCNNNKRNRDAAEWLTKKLGPRKAKKKLAEIQAYFDSLAA